MKDNRIIDKEVINTCVMYRQSIWEQKEIEGYYKVLDVAEVEIEGRRDGIIELRKGSRYFAILASDFMMSVVVEDIKEFDHNFYERLIDRCDKDHDFLLPEKVKVVGKHEFKLHGDDEMTQRLIIKQFN